MEVWHPDSIQLVHSRQTVDIAYRTILLTSSMVHNFHVLKVQFKHQKVQFKPSTRCLDNSVF